MAPKDRPPFLKLLVLSTVWAPVMVLASIVFIAAAFYAVLSPVIGLLYLWLGDYQAALLYLLGGVIAFLVARALKRCVWETPSSFL
ncbi:MAG TPA: hypothetical protein VNB29_09180 [Chthoniobacterales bacterium]|nr:hypothetical protein [Chthoniobacterales bacterium]